MEYVSAVLTGLFEGIGESLWGQVVLSIAGGVILLEIMGLIEGGSVQLLRFGASLLPPALRERYIEENEDGIRSAKGPFSKLICTFSAVTGAIYMKMFLKREELDSLERKSQYEGMYYQHNSPYVHVLSLQDYVDTIRKLSYLKAKRNRLVHGFDKTSEGDLLDVMKKNYKIEHLKGQTFICIYVNMDKYIEIHKIVEEADI